MRKKKATLEDLLKQKLCPSPRDENINVKSEQEILKEKAKNFFDEGVAFLKEEKYFEALFSFFAAFAIDNSLIKAANNIIISLWNLEAKTVAIKMAEHILKIDPENIRAKEHLEFMLNNRE
ncbi:MAG: hypothetical protein HQK76_13185 [Desulfobacterales bacterium]|nr:hypothetical protein [Desulfobacterales bacterium]